MKKSDLGQDRIGIDAAREKTDGGGRRGRGTRAFCFAAKRRLSTFAAFPTKKEKLK
jgi:hypothetical protein